MKAGAERVPGSTGRGARLAALLVVAALVQALGGYVHEAAAAHGQSAGAACASHDGRAPHFHAVRTNPHDADCPLCTQVTRSTGILAGQIDRSNGIADAARRSPPSTRAIPLASAFLEGRPARAPPALA